MTGRTAQHSLLAKQNTIRPQLGLSYLGQLCIAFSKPFWLLTSANHCMLPRFFSDPAESSSAFYRYCRDINHTAVLQSVSTPLEADAPRSNLSCQGSLTHLHQRNNAICALISDAAAEIVVCCQLTEAVAGKQLAACGAALQPARHQRQAFSSYLGSYTGVL